MAMSNSWNNTQARQVYHSIKNLVRSKAGRSWVNGFVTDEQVHEIFVRLASNERFAGFVIQAMDEDEIQRLVHYWGKFYLRNYRRDSVRYTERFGTRYSHDAMSGTKRRNGRGYEPAISGSPPHETRLYWLRFFVGCLPPSLRCVLELRTEGHSFQDIAEQLNISDRTVRRRFHEACELLRNSGLKN